MAKIQYLILENTEKNQCLEYRELTVLLDLFIIGYPVIKVPS